MTDDSGFEFGDVNDIPDLQRNSKSKWQPLVLRLSTLARGRYLKIPWDSMIDSQRRKYQDKIQSVVYQTFGSGKYSFRSRHDGLYITHKLA